jgi:uncharacterized repeat protein (TIGR03803 family)
MRSKNVLIVVGLVFISLVLANSAWAGTETVLYSFCSQSGCTDGGMPTAGMIFDKAHNLYGTTEEGGNGVGVVFKLTHSKSGWKESVLYSFCPESGCADGSYPLGQLVFDKKGNLYGMTDGGGSSACSQGCGTVFELSPSGKGWKFSTLYAFAGGNDGFHPPYGGVVVDKAGNLFGTTEMGGTAGVGTVFELTHTKTGWTKTTIYNFAGGSDAADPLMGLAMDSAGNLFGASVAGGTSGAGAVFELKHSKSAWTESVIYNFTGGSDGAYPEFGQLAITKTGVIYGTAAGGGTYNQGVVYELKHTEAGWVESVLYTFTGADDGGQPFAGPTLDTAGNVFAEAAYLGADSDGTVIELKKSGSGWTEKTLNTFDGTDGKYPYGAVLVGPDGSLYGTTYWGANSCYGGYTCGVVYKIKP